MLASRTVLIAMIAGAWAFCGLLVADTTSAGNQSRKVFPYPVHRTVLANGLAVITVPIDSPGTMSYYTLVRTGSRNEVEPGLSGFAHFFEHMMFRGTPRYSSEKYNDALKQYGADSNAFTSDDWTAYHTTASAAALETVMELEADRFQNLSYDEAGFQKEARAVLGEYNKGASSPMWLLDEKMQDTAFTRHTYKHTTIGFLKDIVDMPTRYQYSKEFFSRWYRPDNCIVLVVGDVKHNQVVQLAKRHYGVWTGKAATVHIPADPPQKEERRVNLTWKGPALPHLYLGYHVPAFDPKSRDIAALDVLSEAVFSTSSPLYRKLVLETGQVQDLYAGATFRRDPTLFTVMARLRDKSDMAKVEDRISAALASAAAKPLHADRLAAIKSHLRYNFALDSTDAVAAALGNYLQLTGDPNSINDIYAEYEKVAAEDVMRVAKAYFAKSNRTALTLVSQDEASTDPPATSADTKQEPAKKIADAPGADAGKGDRATLVRHDAPLGGRAATRTLIHAEKVAGGSGRDRTTHAPLVHVPSKSTHAALRILFRVGSQNDPRGKEGLAALVARMIEEGGSGKLSYQQLIQKLYPIGGEIDSSCDKEMTVFTGKVHHDKLEEFYGLFSGTMLEPRFEMADFERLRNEQLSYLASTLRGTNDEELGKWTLQLRIYGMQHPYGHVDEGTLAGLRAITLDDVKEFYKTHYTQSAVQVGIAGNADAKLVDRMRQDFSERFPLDGARPPKLPRARMPKGLSVTIVEKPTIATAISLGYPIDVTRADDDFYALLLANSALGEHRTFNGRLMINMRAKRGLNYGDYSYVENFIQEGSSVSRFVAPSIARRQQYFSIWIRPVPHDKAVFALRQALREHQLFVEKGLTHEEFEATRRFLFNYSKLWVQTPSRRLGFEMDGRFYGRESLVDELARRLPEMTLEGVNAAIKRHLQSENIVVAMVTQDPQQLSEKLTAGQPTPLVYDTQGTPADVLDEDKTIAEWPLDIRSDQIRIVPVTSMFER